MAAIVPRASRRLVALLALLGSARAAWQQARARAEQSIEKLLFSVGPVLSATAGGHQFRSIWTRDFCHSTIGLLEKEKWSVAGRGVPATSIVASTLTAILSPLADNMTLTPRVLDHFAGFPETSLTAKVVANTLYLDGLRAAGMDVGEHLAAEPAAPLQACYDGESGVKATVDGGYNVLNAFSRLAAKLSGEELRGFLAKNTQGLRHVLAFYNAAPRWVTRRSRWFLWQGPYEEWKDSLKQTGVSSFTNLGLIEALERLLLLAGDSDDVWAALAGVPLFARRFGTEAISGDRSESAVLLKSLRQWKLDVFDVFYRSDVGLLIEILPDQEDAVLSSIAHIDSQLQWIRATEHDPELRSKISIDNIAKAFVDWAPNRSAVKYVRGISAKAWPASEVSTEKSLLGLSQYHGTMAWTWWTGSFAQLAAAAGRIDLAQKLLAWIVEVQQDPKLAASGFGKYISEVYDETGIVASPLYTSETPFLWGSSYVLHAAAALERATAAELMV